MKVNLPNDSKKYLTGETGITERSLDAHKRLTPHLNLIRFQPVMYELTYDEKYALWLLYSKEKGYTFLPLDKALSIIFLAINVLPLATEQHKQICFLPFAKLSRVF